MSKKSIIICVIVAAVLLLGIAVAVFILYDGGGKSEKEDSNKNEAASLSHMNLIQAVPTDAVAVLTLSDCQNTSELIPQRISVPEGLESVKQVVVSLHNNAQLVPLFISSRDSVNLDIESPSQTLIGSSKRHIEEGNSIADNKQFMETLKEVSDRNSLFFANEYASKVFQSYFGEKYSKYVPFVRNISEWMGFTIVENSESRLALQGKASCGKSASYYYNVLKNQGQGESKIIEILPSNASFAISLQVSNLKKYGESYKKYLDSSHQLGQFKESVLDWADKAGLKEVAYATWTTVAGAPAEALFVRSSRTPKRVDAAVENSNAGYVTSLFGNIFSVEDESCCVYCGEWTVSGSRESVEDILEAYNLDDNYSYASPAVFVSYSKGAFNIEKIFAPSQARRKTSRSDAAEITIPQGPFTVKNCSTGKMNEFYQNDKNYLCLNDETGKLLWNVAFSEPISGRVGQIDYLKNEKIQFLFAAGTKLYLIDRLGRMVSGFPVELNKKVLIGPDVYDFDGNKEYKVMILHTDNTIDLYDLQGNKSNSWKGITSDDVIIDLPKLLKQNDKQYWIVNTSRGTQVFGFDGGEALKGKEIRNLEF